MKVPPSIRSCGASINRRRLDSDRPDNNCFAVAASRRVGETRLSQYYKSSGRRCGGTNSVLSWRSICGNTCSRICAGITGKSKEFFTQSLERRHKARVVIYAAMIDDRAPRKETETPIATFAIAI